MFYRAENRRRRKGSRFGVESKVFEVEVEERKGKPQVTIVERERGFILGLVGTGEFRALLGKFEPVH